MMDFIFICLIAAAVIWALKQHSKNLSQAEKYTRTLGLRKPHKFDGFERKACEQFREECSKHSIDVDYRNMPNLCTYLRILERKGMHLELVKDGLVRYKVSPEEKYLGTEAWQKEWGRIIFSPSIDAEDFCNCIQLIMAIHNLDASRIKDLYDFKGNDGIIKTKDSFFIYRALHIMHYHILIRKNDTDLKEFEIKSSKQLMENDKRPIDNTYELIPLENLANIIEGRKVSDSYIRTEGNYPPIIYTDNIMSGSYNLKCSQYGAYINDGCIVLCTLPPFEMNIWNDEAAIAEGVIGIEVNTHIINCEYLFLYLKLMFHKLLENGAQKIKIEELRQVNIVVVPAHIQREIIKKGVPVRNDIQQLENIFSSYNETYPLLRLMSK